MGEAQQESIVPELLQPPSGQVWPTSPLHQPVHWSVLCPKTVSSCAACLAAETCRNRCSFVAVAIYSAARTGIAQFYEGYFCYPHSPVLLLLPSAIWFRLTVRRSRRPPSSHTLLISSVHLRSRLQDDPSNRSYSISKKWLNMEASHLCCYCGMNVFQLWQPCRTFGSHLRRILITTEHQMINTNNRQRPNRPTDNYLNKSRRKKTWAKLWEVFAFLY